MKLKKVRDQDDTETRDFGTVGSASTGSYDTTEDLTDTDTSSHIHRRKRGPNDIIRVRFAVKDNIVHDVESHNDFTPKERGNYWWSEREKDRMMAKHERLVAKYEQQRSGTKPGSKKISTGKMGSYRGLESWTAAGSLKLDHTIERCITAVMDEQDRQWNENDDDLDIIAQKSLAVTEDSARRARLNGLQDAQEALRIRGETWSKQASDEMSIGSAVSTGTAAVAKKKKRSKLLARLDDSSKLLKSTASNENDDVLDDLKKARRKKTKKSKKAKKSKRTKSSKSKKGRESNDGDTTDTKTTQPNTVASYLEEHEKTPLANIDIPISPLATPETTDDYVYPLLAALREEQGKLKESLVSSGENPNPSRGSESIRSIYDRVPATVDSDEDDIVALLRQQQRKNAEAWASPEKGDGGNLGIPQRSGDPVSKLSSLREDYTRIESPTMSDPPGRRPRRLASRQGDYENPRPYDKKKEKKMVPSDLPTVDEGKSRHNFGNMGGILRNGAKSLFKKGAKA